MARLRKSAIDGKVETLVMTVLQDGPSYGYQIVRDLNEKAADLLQLGEGTVYPVLHRLEEKELIAGTWQHDGQRGRPRKYYRLTPRGRRAMNDNLKQWADLVELMRRFGGDATPAPSP